MKHTHIKIGSILLYLLPAALVTGPFLSDLIVSILALSFLIISIKKKIWNYYTSIFFKFFFIFYLYIVIRSIFAEDLFFSLKSSFFYIRFGVFSLAVWYLIDNNSQLIKKFTFWGILTLVLISLDAYIQIVFGKNIIGLPVVEQKISGIFGSELVLGSYITRMLPLYVAGIIYSLKSVDGIKYKLLILLTSCITLVFLSGERSSFALMILYFISFVLFTKKWFKIKIISLITSIVFIIFFATQSERLQVRMIDNTLTQFGLETIKEYQIAEIETRLHKELDFVIFSPSHTIHYLTAYKMFKDNVVFGQGVKMYRMLCNKEKYYINSKSCVTHPHNTYVQFLAETGLIGFTFIFLSFIYVVILLIKNLPILKKKHPINDYRICLLLCFLVTLWPITPNGNFFNNWLSIIYFLPVGFYLQDLKNSIN